MNNCEGHYLLARKCKTLSTIELNVMRVIWRRGKSAVKDVHQALPAKTRPTESLVRSVMYRLVKKSALRRSKTIKCFLYEAVITVEAERRGIIDELLAFLNGSPKAYLDYIVSSDGFKHAKKKTLDK